MTNGMRSRFESGEDSPGLLLWRVTNRWQATMRAALVPFELTHVQFVLLATLAWGGEDGITQIEVATRAGTDPMMTSQVLRALEGKGLVSRRPHPTDRRARLIAVTPEGARLADQANAVVEAADAAFFGSGADASRTLLAHLAALSA